MQGKLIEEFFVQYFGSSFDRKKAGVLVGIKSEAQLYLKEEWPEGYSSYYCMIAWNEEGLKNDADLELFDLFFEIDVTNGADTTKILHGLCRSGAFGALKVRVKFKNRN